MFSEDQVLQKVSNKKQKQILLFIIVFCVFLIIVLIAYMYLYLDSQPLVEFPMYELSTEEWTTDNVVITVTNDAKDIQSYSFDGGKTWQTNQSYEVTENGEFQIQVMDIKNKISKKNIVVVSNIDRTPPMMTFESSTTVQMGTNFSVRTGVQVSDKESGLSNNYTSVPSTIDTSVEGEYKIVYSAFDRAGNFVEKERTIIVKDIKGRTYYRYRDGVVESYDCEPYLCRCVTSDQASSTGTCPTGYTLNEEGQCCNTCYKTCTKTNWGEWSKWSQKKITATPTREVESILVEDGQELEGEVE